MIYELTFICLANMCPVGPHNGDLFADEKQCEAVAEYLTTPTQRAVCIPKTRTRYEERAAQNRCIITHTMGWPDPWSCLWNEDAPKICGTNGKEWPARNGNCYSTDAPTSPERKVEDIKIGTTALVPPCRNAGELLVAHRGMWACWPLEDIKAGKLPKP